MTSEDIVEILQLFAGNGIRVHVDGGWGVDALLGEQSRSHADLDIAVRHGDVPRLRELLEARGYRESPRDGSWECNFVLTDGSGHEVDVHSYVFDSEGENIFGVPYSAESLTGVGIIDGHEVECISPAWMIAFHTGYELGLNDYRDISALCDRYGVDLPSEYIKFRKKPQ